MVLTLQILQIIFYSVSILFMITFMIIGIWSFILFMKFVKNKMLQTDILSKINKNIYLLSNSSTAHKKSNIEPVDKVSPNESLNK